MRWTDMVYGYARVSTKGQAKDGNSLESQERVLREAGAEVVYTDSFTGTKMDRPQFSLLLNKLESGDTLIVTKLDRFARSVGQASDVITKLIDRGVTVHVLNLGVLSNDSVSTLLRNVLLSFAQFERDMIVQRTQEGKAIARENPDWREGRKPLEVDWESFKQCRERVAAGVATVTECCKELGIGRTSWYKLVKEEVA